MKKKSLIVFSLVSLFTLQATTNVFAETDGPRKEIQPKPSRNVEQMKRMEQVVDVKNRMQNAQDKMMRQDKASSQSARFSMFQKQILATANRLVAVSTKLETFTTELQTKITQAQGSGQDVTALNSLLTDMKAKLASAKTQGQTVITTVTPLTAEGFPANKTTLMSARDSLKTGNKDLMAALKDAKQIVKGLHRDSQKSPTSPPTTTP